MSYPSCWCQLDWHTKAACRHCSKLQFVGKRVCSCSGRRCFAGSSCPSCFPPCVVLDLVVPSSDSCCSVRESHSTTASASRPEFCSCLGFCLRPQREAPTVIDHIRTKKIDLVINLPTSESKRLEDNYMVRRTAVDHGIPLLTNLNLVKLFTSSLLYNKKMKLVGLDPDSLFDYYEREKPEEAW